MGLCDSSWQFLRTKVELATRSRDLIRILEWRMSWDLQQHWKGPAGMLLAAILYLWSLWLPGAAGNSPSSPQHVIIIMQVGKKGCRNQRHWQCPSNQSEINPEYSTTWHILQSNAGTSNSKSPKGIRLMYRLKGKCPCFILNFQV